MTRDVVSDDCVGDVSGRNNRESAVRLFSAELNVETSEVSQINTDEAIRCESLEDMEIDSVEMTIDADGNFDGAESASFSINKLQRNGPIDVPGETESFGDCSGDSGDG